MTCWPGGIFEAKPINDNFKNEVDQELTKYGKIVDEELKD